MKLSCHAYIAREFKSITYLRVHSRLFTHGYSRKRYYNFVLGVAISLWS